MTPDEFRTCGHALVDWIARYYETVEERPVLSQVAPGQIRSQLPEHAPETGESFAAMLQDVDQIIMPGVTHWQSPNFYAFFPSNTSFPSILGELLASGLGVQGMLWATSPACTELETHVMDWVAEMMALPPAFRSSASGGGVIQDSASSSVLCAILAARERMSKLATNEMGCDGTLVAYTSTQAHSSIEKAIKIAGIGKQNLHLVDVDERYAMRPESLRQKIAEDKRAGRRPFFVAATIGTTSSNAMDPLAAIGQIAREEGLWFHVDGAMAGTAAVCAEFRHFLSGLEYADSYAFNPHKWMFTNFDCSCFFVASRADLINSLSILPEYLRNKATESGAVIDYRDWQISLGRRFRSLKLWFVIRHYGVQGLQIHIQRHVELAQQLAARIKADPRFELTVEPPLNLVCFRLKGGDETNQQLMDRLNQSGKLYLTHTKLADKMVLRMCIGQSQTDQVHVDKAWELIQATAAQLLS
jgi:aromatic-L-amino-acid decarboxylase